MTSKRTSKASQPFPITMEWADSSGYIWKLTGQWAFVDGRLTMVALNIVWGGHEPAELTQRVLRGIPIARVRETMRQQAAEIARHLAASAFAAAKASMAAARAADFLDLAEAHTAQNRPRKRLPAATPDLLAEVARLYLDAVAAGDKTPAKSLETSLRSAGYPVSERGGRDLVRKWIQRARERGLIPPVSEPRR